MSFFLKSRIHWLMREAKREPFYGDCLTLGVIPDVQFSNQVQHSKYKSELKKQGSFWERIGFDKVQSLDISNYEGADIIFNLNEDIPDSLMNKFDCIIDPGTIEHCFNIPIVMNNLSKMLKVNGRILHWNGLTNAIDHGFYMFSPTFFHDYYKNKGFLIKDSYICELSFKKYFLAKIYEIDENRVDWFKSKNACDLAVTVKKMSNSNDIFDVIQSSYLRKYDTTNLKRSPRALRIEYILGKKTYQFIHSIYRFKLIQLIRLNLKIFMYKVIKRKYWLCKS
jgi:hypothetical protein